MIVLVRGVRRTMSLEIGGSVRSKVLTLCLISGAIAIAPVEGAMAVDMEGRPRVVPTDYDSVTPAELISVYRYAYTNAGFKVKQQTTRQEKGVGGRKITRLVFELLNSEKS